MKPARDFVAEALGEPPAPADDIPAANGPEDYGLSDTPPPAPLIVLPALLHLSAAEWIERDLPEPDYILGRWLTTTSRAMLVAATGLGKTMFLMGLGMAVAEGAGFLHWQGSGSPARVLYIDGEMNRRLLKKRISAEVARRGSVPEGFFALSHEDIEGFAPLNTPAGQACVEHIIDHLGGIDLVIFDSVMCLTQGDMKDGLAWAQVMPWIRHLTKHAIGQIWAHHTGHDESRSYGDKTKEWQLDTVLHLEAVKRDETDLSFSLEFRKARERTPDSRADFQPVRVALIEDRWQHDGEAAQRPGHASPLALKFLDALNNVLAGSGISTIAGRKAATSDAWRAEAVTLGLIDPKAKPDSARNLFNKYRRELLGANRIACQDDLTWTL